MSGSVRRASLVGFAAVAVAVIAASAAWACSPAARIDCAQSSAREGTAGTRVLITGCSFSDSTPVEIRWDSQTGPLLTTATGPEFSVGVNVPANATPGPHMIVAVFRYSNDLGATVRETRQLGFTVTPSGAPGSTQGTVTAGAASGGDLADLPAPAPQPATPVAQPSPSAGSPAPGVVPAPDTASTATATPALGSLPASANPGAVRTPAGRVVFGGSTPSVAASGSAQPAVADDQASQPAVAPRAASGDLWSGFQANAGSPAFGLETNTSGAGANSGTPVGVALFGAGLMALLAGFGAAELGRRRALAHAGDSSQPS